VSTLPLLALPFLCHCALITAALKLIPPIILSCLSTRARKAARAPGRYADLPRLRQGMGGNRTFRYEPVPFQTPFQDSRAFPFTFQLPQNVRIQMKRALDRESKRCHEFTDQALDNFQNGKQEEREADGIPRQGRVQFPL